MKIPSTVNKITWYLLFFLIQSINAQPYTQIQHIYPIPGTIEHPAETHIIVRFTNLTPEQIKNFESFIEVTAEDGMAVNGKSVISSDNKTIIFKPLKPFAAGEEVFVRLRPVPYGMYQAIIDTSYCFIISESSAIPEQADFENTDELVANIKVQSNMDSYPQIIGGVSVPSDFPAIDIAVNEDPDSGYIFICTYFSPYYAMIFDNSGAPIWYLKAKDRRRDLKVQKDGRITTLAKSGYGGGSHIAFDSTYTLVDTFFIPPGYVIDEHELQVLENGHYLSIFSDTRTVDMSQLVEGGNPNARVMGHHFAEMDANDNPILIWRSWDHLKIEEVINLDITKSSFEFVHMNAIEIDHDNNILISNRNRSEILKLDRKTGEIIWTLGGANNQFTWVNDDQHISYQHDIRVLPNGNYTLFDNGNYHTPQHSRALELKVDTLNKEVTKIWEYSYEPIIYSKYMGNVQRLPNGHTLINWAICNKPKLSEVRPDGSTVFEMDYINSNESYRTFRFPWNGMAKVPYLVIETWDKSITLIFNKFGDPDVAYYNVYGGLNEHPNKILASTTEPFVHFFDLIDGAYYYFRVTSVNSAEQESGFSNEERVLVRSTQPGENMVKNGDFSDGFNYWTWDVDTSAAEAQYEINDSGELHLKIADGGEHFSNINVSYPGLTVVQDREYVFEFDAYSSNDRVVEVDIENLSNPSKNYSRIGYTALSTQTNHYSHLFSMDEVSDFNAGIIINAGYDDSDIYFDNFSLKSYATGFEKQIKPVPEKFSLQSNYPNPFNPITNIKYNLPELSSVTLIIYNLHGQEVKKLQNNNMRAGQHSVRFDASNLASGIYFYKLKVQSLSGSQIISDSKKMILLK